MLHNCFYAKTWSHAKIWFPNYIQKCLQLRLQYISSVLRYLSAWFLIFNVEKYQLWLETWYYLKLEIMIPYRKNFLWKKLLHNLFFQIFPEIAKLNSTNFSNFTQLWKQIPQCYSDMMRIPSEIQIHSYTKVKKVIYKH